MKKMNEMYELKITDRRWIAYDIPGNVGWIMYYVGLILCYIKRPEYMQNQLIFMLIMLSVIPAIAMLVGIVELVSERIKKLDRLLPKKRVLRGFGALTYGGIGGIVISLATIISSIILKQTEGMVYLGVMCVGAILCALFGGLLYKGFHKCEK